MIGYLRIRPLIAVGTNGILLHEEVFDFCSTELKVVGLGGTIVDMKDVVKGHFIH